MHKLFKSNEARPGVMSQLGTLHVHIDGAHDTEKIEKILRELDAAGNISKLNDTVEFIAGSQRSLEPETYQSHTPGFAGEEEFNFFSTTLLHDRGNAVQTVRHILENLRNDTSAIIELEYIVAKLDWSGEWTETPFEAMPALTKKDIEFEALASLPIEIHHGFDVPKKPGALPLALSDLLQDTAKLGVIVGGWFVFEKEQAWAYRSNAFAKIEGVRELVEHENRILRTHLKQKGFDLPVRTLVERVLGIWRPSIGA